MQPIPSITSAHVNTLTKLIKPEEEVICIHKDKLIATSNGPVSTTIYAQRTGRNSTSIGLHVYYASASGQYTGELEIQEDTVKKFAFYDKDTRVITKSSDSLSLSKPSSVGTSVDKTHKLDEKLDLIPNLGTETSGEGNFLISEAEQAYSTMKRAIVMEAMNKTS